MTDTEPTQHLHLSTSAVMVLHSTFVDNVMRHPPEVIAVMATNGALSLGTFATNLATSVLRLRPTVDDEHAGAVAMELFDGQHYSTLAVIPGELLGLDPDELGSAWSERLDDELRKVTEE